MTTGPSSSRDCYSIPNWLGAPAWCSDGCSHGLEAERCPSILLVCTPIFSAIPYFKQKTKHFIHYASVQVGLAPSIPSSELPHTSKAQNQCMWETLDIWFCLMESQAQFVAVQ